jgi:multidrug efflux pump subunit AcrA (membrane-fusion protein)
MNKAFPIAAVIFLSLCVRGMAQIDSGEPSGAPSSDPTVDGFVKVADHIKLPAEEAGVLMHLAVKEGSQVKAGQQIGKIDDREIQIQKQAAGYAWGAAIKKVEDDVDIRYSRKGAEHAKADLEVMESANTVVERAITDVEVRAARLNWEKMVLATEKAEKERELANYDAHVKKAEYDAAKLAIDRRAIAAPFDGVVEELSRKQGEWVNPGDAILKLFRMDVMHVNGAVRQDRYDPYELQGCKVTVEVQMARGRTETFEGRITKVSSSIRGDSVYDIRAEVANRQEHGSWMLRDNLPAKMTIHLGTGSDAVESARRAP